MAEELQTYLLEHFQWLDNQLCKKCIKTDRRCGAFESGT